MLMNSEMPISAAALRRHLCLPFTYSPSQRDADEL